MQRDKGNSFVSRTMLTVQSEWNENALEKIVVLRSVLMNPMTNIEILNEILDEQEALYRTLSQSSVWDHPRVFDQTASMPDSPPMLLKGA